MWVDLGVRRALSRRATCLVALAAMIAAAGPAAAQSGSSTTQPSATPGAARPNAPAASGGAPSGASLDNDPTVIRGLEIHAGIGLDEIFTDNARGVASGGQLTVLSNNAVITTPQAKTADLVSRVTPMLSIIDRTARLQAGMVFQPSYQKYALATDLDRFDNALTATGSAELWREHLTLDASASISREVINTQGAVTANQRAINNNQADLQSYILSPTYRQAFGNFALGKLQYQFGSTSTGAIAPATSNGIAAELKSGANFARLDWTARLEASRTSQGATPDPGGTVNNVATPTSTNATSRRTAQFDSVYAWNHTVALLSGFGYETIQNGSLTNNPKGPIGDVGIRLTGARLELTLKINSRYDSTFMSAEGKYELGPQLHLRFSYNESVTTTQEQTLGDLGQLRLTPNGTFQNTQTGQPFTPVNSPFGINSGFGNTAFRDRTGRLALDGTFGRNSYTMSALDESRTTETTNFNETSIALAAGLARELTPMMKYNLSLGYTTTEDRSPIQRTDDTYNLSTGLSFLLNNGLTASATYGLVYRRSTAAGQDVRENSFILGIRKSI
jgi:uncharacterized protein (PEP-CTERM system associated)